MSLTTIDCLGLIHSALGDIAHEHERLADGVHRVADALNRLGNADALTPMGGLEAHGAAILEAASAIAAALGEIKR